MGCSSSKDTVFDMGSLKIVFVLGGPGCGKGTQCDKIVADFHYKHLSAGDLLREEVASGSERGKELDAIMKEGKLVPVAVTLGLLRAAIDRIHRVEHGDRFLIDGFPRETDQAVEFEKEVCACLFVSVLTLFRE